MATTIGDLLVKLGVDARDIAKGFDAADARIEKIGTHMFFMGGRISAGVTVPLVAAGAAITKFGMDFDKAMTESLAIMQNVTPQIRTQMEGVAADVARSTKFSAKEAAEAYYSLASAGLSASESMGALPIAARFAQAGVFDLAKSTDYLAAAQAALGSGTETSAQKIEQMAVIADVLTEANNRALGTVEDFAQAITNRAGQQLRLFNKDVQEGTAVLAAYAQQGIKGKTAGQQLYMMIRDLARANLRNNQIWKENNIAVFDSAGNMRNLADIISDMEARMAGMSDAQKRATLMTLGMQDRSLAATQVLIGYSDAIRAYEKQLRSAAGVTQSVADKQMEALSNQWKRIRNEVELLAIELFQTLVPVIQDSIIPAVKGLISAGAGVVDFFAAMPGPIKTGTVALAALAAALGPVTMGLGSLTIAGSAIVQAFHNIARAAGMYGAQVGSAAAVSTSAALAGDDLARALTQVGKESFAAAKASGASHGAAMQMAKAARQAFTAQNALATGTTATGVAMTATAAKTAGLGAALVGFATNPITLSVAALAGLAAGIYYVATADSELEKELKRSTDTFKLHTTELENSLTTYMNLKDRQSLTKEETLRLDDATRKLAEASGLSTEAFNKEEQASGRLTSALISQVNARKDVLDSMVDSLRTDAADAASKLDEARKRLSDVLSGKAMSRRYDVRAGVVIETPMSGTERVQQVSALTKQIEDLERKATDARHSLEALMGAKGTTDVELPLGEGEERDPRLPKPPPKPEPDGGGMPDFPNRLRQQADEVQKLYDELFGRGKSELATMEKLWQKHGAEIQANLPVMYELGERYVKIRKDTGLTIPVFEKLFATQIEGHKASAHSLSSYEEIFDKATAEFVEKSDEVAGAFSRLASRGQASLFFKKHQSEIENLIPIMGELPPEIQKIIRAYMEWKLTSREATEAARKNMADAFNKISEISDKFVGELQDKQADVQLFTQNYADREIAGLRRGMGRMRVEHAKQLKAMRDEIMTLPEQEQFAAWERYRIAEQHSKDIIALTEREGAFRLAKAAGVSEKLIRNSDRYTNQELINIAKQKLAWQDLWETIQDGMNLARNIGDLFGVMGFDKLSESISGVNQGVSTFMNGLNQEMNAENFTQTLGGWIQQATGLIQVYKSLSQTVGRGNRALSGAIAGAQIGSMFGPIGAGVGAAVGAAAGALMKDPRWAQVAQHLGERFGARFSEELGKRIEADAKEIFEGSFDAAQIFNLDQIIGEAGGLNAGNFREFTKMFRDVFSMIEIGEMSVAQATQVVDKNFGTFAQHVVDSNKVASKSFLELITLTKQFGIESKAVIDFLAGQTGRFGNAMSSVLTHTGKAAEELAKKIEEAREKGDRKTFDKLIKEQAALAAATKAEAEDLGVIMLSTFNAAIASGLNWTQVMTQMGPSIIQLSDLFKNLGISSDNAAVRTLTMYGELMKANESLFASVGGLTEAYLAMSNIPGAFTQESFQAMNDQMRRQFTEMQAAVAKLGGSHRDALLPFIPMLEHIRDLAKEHGFVIDANTQALIDQAEQMGLLGERELTTNEHLQQSTDVMLLGFAAIIEALGGVIPPKMQELIDKMNEVGEAAGGAADTAKDAWIEASGDMLERWTSDARIMGVEMSDEMKATFEAIKLMAVSAGDQTFEAWYLANREAIGNISKDWQAFFDEILRRGGDTSVKSSGKLENEFTEAAEEVKRKWAEFYKYLQTQNPEIKVRYRYEQNGPGPEVPDTRERPLSVPGRDTGAYKVVQPHLAVVHSNEAIVPIDQLWQELDQRFEEFGPAPTSDQERRPVLVVIDGRGKSEDEILNEVYARLPEDVRHDYRGLRTSLRENLGVR